jgi:hypothetical protein
MDISLELPRCYIDVNFRSFLCCRAPAVFADFLGEFIVTGHVSFKEVVAAVLEAGEAPEKEEGDKEEPDMPLVDAGEAGPIVMKMLAAIKVGGGEVLQCSFGGGRRARCIGLGLCYRVKIVFLFVTRWKGAREDCLLAIGVVSRRIFTARYRMGIQRLTLHGPWCGR